MKIEKPIFIIGSGRSGTTILYNLLSIHPEVCWFSNVTDKFPRIHLFAMFHRILNIPFLGKRLKSNIINSTGSKFNIRPSEGQNIYHTYSRFEHARKTTEKDFDKKIEKRLKQVVKGHLVLTGKKRFMTKQTTNNQRIRLINTFFNDAFYIHIIRDGRAVANSLLHTQWWDDVDIWWLGHKPHTWRKIGREPIELCALHWKREVQEIIQNVDYFKERYLEIKYEKLTEDVKHTVKTITDFCELKFPDKFSALLPETLPNMNYKWKNQLLSHEKSILTKALEQFLIELDYRIE